MEFGILGPLEVREGSREVLLGGPKQRKLFARLLLDRNRVVSVESLMETLWPNGLPSDPSHQIQVYVSQIRKALGPHGASLETTPPGYRLRTEPDVVDLDRFESLCSDARSALDSEDFARTIALCDQALDLWRGPFMHGFEGEDFAYPDSVRAEALRSQAEIDRLTALLGTGQGRALVPELEARTAADPGDERYALLLMRALHEVGRQGDAIEAFHRCRAALADDLGVDPSPELQDLFTRLLRGEPAPAIKHAGTEARALDKPGGLARLARLSRSQLVVSLLIIVLTVSVATAAVLTRGPLEDDIAAIRAQSVGVIDPSSGRIVGDLPLPVRPTRAAFGLGALWVTSSSAGQVVRVDPQTFSIRQTIDVGAGVGPVAFADSAVWVANADDGTLARIDPETNEVVQRVRVGNGPSDIMAVGDYLWIANRLDSSVAKFDPRRGAVVERIRTGSSPGRLAATDDSLWVTDEALSAVEQVDLTSGAVSTVHVGNGPGAVTAVGDDVWVVNRSDETVSHIGASGRVEAAFGIGRGVSTIVDVDGVPWVGHQDAVVRIDPEDPASSSVVATGAASADMAVGGGRVWVVTEPSLAEHSGGTLRVLIGHIDSLDPAMAYFPESWRILDVLNDGLVSYGGPGGRSLVPNLATAIPAPSNGGRTFVFRLRQGIRFSTGEELVPDDVRHSFERVLGNNLETAGLFSSIVGGRSCGKEGDGCDLSRGIVTSEGSRTITFHLTHPDPDFIAKLATPVASIVPSSVPMTIQDSVPSTGPYEVASYEPQDQIVLERREGFRQWSSAAQPAGYVDRIVVDLGTKSADARKAVLEGDADWTDELGSGVDELRRRYGSQIHVIPQLATFAVFLNTRVPPFDDVEVRRALNLAVDREEMQHVLGGTDRATITCQILPPGMQGYDPYCPYTADPSSSGAWLAPDLARAERLLRGKERVPVTVFSFDFLAGAAEHTAAVLRDLGYPAKSRVLPIGRFFDMVDSEPDVQAGVFGWFADVPGPSGFIRSNFACALARGRIPTTNTAHFCDRDIDRMSKRAGELQFTDPHLANELWARIDRKLTAVAAWLPIVNPKGTDLVSERVGNYTYSPVTGVILSQLWVK